MKNNKIQSTIDKS